MKDLYFPILKRRNSYDTRVDGTFYYYSTYRQPTWEDCQGRCVYCDIIEKTEHGGEGLQLDHFRPGSKFPHLENDPTNLVLCCPGCNRNKSNHWPCSDPNSSHDYQSGFIDPFTEDRHKFFYVKKGELTPKSGPARYMIDLLNLNRPGRTVVRYCRRLQFRLQNIREKIKKMVSQNTQIISSEECEKEARILGQKRLERLTAASAKLEKLISDLYS